jgi:hypothetical protein
MNIDFSLIIQIIFIALVFYLFYVHVDTRVYIRYIKTFFIYEQLSLKYCLDYEIVLSQKDTESYHRYEIWRFFEKVK